MKAWIRPTNRSKVFQMALGSPLDVPGEHRDQRHQDAAGEDVAEESQCQRDRLGDLLDDVDRRQERDVALDDLDRVADEAAAPDARRVVADEHEQRQRQHEVDIGGRRLVAARRRRRRTRRTASGRTASQLEIRMKTKMRDGERQHERRDLHADRALDLLAHLDGQRLPEQLHATGYAGGGDLGLAGRTPGR